MLRRNRLLEYLRLKRVYQYYLDRHPCKVKIEVLREIKELDQFFKSPRAKNEYLLDFVKRRKVDLREIDKHEQILKIVNESTSTKGSKRKNR